MWSNHWPALARHMSLNHWPGLAQHMTFVLTRQAVPRRTGDVQRVRLKSNPLEPKCLFIVVRCGPSRTNSLRVFSGATCGSRIGKLHFPSVMHSLHDYYAPVVHDIVRLQLFPWSLLPLCLLPPLTSSHSSTHMHNMHNVGRNSAQRNGYNIDPPCRIVPMLA